MTANEKTRTGRIETDGKVFIDTHFKDAELVYAGGEPPRFEACRFDNARFTFAGPAARTLAYLRAMAPAETNMRGVVTGLIPELA